MKKTSVLVLVHYYAPGFKAGGPVRSIVNMVDRLGEVFDFRIITADRDVMDETAYTDVRVNAWNRVGKGQVYYIAPERRSTRQLAGLIAETDHDVLYLNSFFDLEFTVRPLLARRLKWLPERSTVLAPRGEFSWGALEIKRWRKAQFIRLARVSRLYQGLVWHASNEHEARDIQRGFDVPSERIMLARNLSAYQESLAVKSPRATDMDRPLRIVFLSRISRKKNVTFALEVLAHVTSPVEFDIWGTIEDEPYWRQCQQLIGRMPRHVRATYRGVAEPTRVVRVLSDYDLFFLPTQGENYGHVILEALSSGLPVLISDQTPWSDVEERGIGWAVPLDDRTAFVRVVERECGRDVVSRIERRERIIAFATRHTNDQDAVMQNRRLFENARHAA